MRRQWSWIVGLAITAANPDQVVAGTFSGTARCDDMIGCEPGVTTSEPTQQVTPFGTTHPLGYDGTQSVLTLRVCLANGSELFAGPLARAIAMWNNLAPEVGNCLDCKVWEDVGSEPPVATILHAQSVLAHELGHCPLGLEHPDRNYDADADIDLIKEFTSYTRSLGVVAPTPGSPNSGGLQSGPDFVRGSRDDTHLGPMSAPATSVSWYRRADNNPFVVDGTVIDTTTYSRSLTNLPAGSSWPANANRYAGETAFGTPNSQALMYALIAEGTRFVALGADDVNMLRMGMTGADSMAGTSDDYTVTLEASCEDPIAVFVALGPLEDGVGAQCNAVGVDFSFTPPGGNPLLARHYSVTAPSKGYLSITLSEDVTWDLDDPIVFRDGFETGGTGEWSLSVP